MKSLWNRAVAQLPDWAQELLGLLLPALQALLILLAALLLQKLLRRMVPRVFARYGVPDEFSLLTRRALSFAVFGGALLLALERLGVSSGVLWGAFTSFAAVGAVAFFAAWSVLSNVFCSLLIFSTRMFRLNDYIEVMDGGDKPGFKGRVVDINLVYTTLQETGTAGHGTLLKVPNSLLFQRTLRQWRTDEEAARPPLLPARPFNPGPADAPAQPAAPEAAP